MTIYFSTANNTKLTRREEILVYVSIILSFISLAWRHKMQWQMYVKTKSVNRTNDYIGLYLYETHVPNPHLFRFKSIWKWIFLYRGAYVKLYVDGFYFTCLVKPLFWFILIYNEGHSLNCCCKISPCQIPCKEMSKRFHHSSDFYIFSFLYVNH